MPARGTDPVTEDRALLMIDQALDRHTERIANMLDTRLTQTEKHLMEAFPNGDAHGHRVAHEKFIDRARKCVTLKEQIAGHVVTWGVMATIGWLALVAWEAIKREATK